MTSSWLAVTSWAATSSTWPPTHGRSCSAAAMQMAARMPASSQCWRPGIASGGPSSGPTWYISPLIAWAVSGVIRQSRNGPVAPNGVSRHVTTDAAHQLEPERLGDEPDTGVAAVGDATTTSTSPPARRAAAAPGRRRSRASPAGTPLRTTRRATPRADRRSSRRRRADAPAAARRRRSRRAAVRSTALTGAARSRTRMPANGSATAAAGSGIGLHPLGGRAARPASRATMNPSMRRRASAAIAVGNVSKPCSDSGYTSSSASLPAAVQRSYMNRVSSSSASAVPTLNSAGGRPREVGVQRRDRRHPPLLDGEPRVHQRLGVVEHGERAGVEALARPTRHVVEAVGQGGADDVGHRAAPASRSASSVSTASVQPADSPMSTIGPSPSVPARRCGPRRRRSGHPRAGPAAAPRAPCGTRR